MVTLGGSYCQVPSVLLVQRLSQLPWLEEAKLLLDREAQRTPIGNQVLRELEVCHLPGLLTSWGQCTEWGPQ